MSDGITHSLDCWKWHPVCAQRRCESIEAALITEQEHTAVLECAVRLQVDNIERWMKTGVPAGPEESKAIYEALKHALGEMPND